MWKPLAPMGWSSCDGVAQRPAGRRLCPGTRSPFPPAERDHLRLGSMGHCRAHGWRGRQRRPSRSCSCVPPIPPAPQRHGLGRTYVIADTFSRLAAYCPTAALTLLRLLNQRCGLVHECPGSCCAAVFGVLSRGRGGDEDAVLDGSGHQCGLCLAVRQGHGGLDAQGSGY